MLLLTIPVPKVSVSDLVNALENQTVLNTPDSRSLLSLLLPLLMVGKMIALRLKCWHDQVIDILAEYNLFLISGAIDGTETEHKLQHLIDSTSNTLVKHLVASSTPHLSFTLTMALINGHPLINVQDSKHGRNQILSGACTLVIGQEVINYLMFWQNNILSHLFHSLMVNFISQELFNVLMTLCESYIKLV